MAFEKSAIQNLHWTLDEVESADYFLLMEILSTDPAEIEQEKVYDDPVELLNKLETEGHT